MTTEPRGELKPVPPDRVADELVKLSKMRMTGQLERDEYEHRFARMISELRDRRIGGTRKDIMAAIQPHIDDGTIHVAEFERFVRQLGLA